MPAALYPHLLGDAWTRLDERVRRSHMAGEPLRLVGRFRIRRGTGPLARLLLSLLHAPPAAESVAAELRVTPAGCGERWARRFGDRRWVTMQAPGDGGVLIERAGIIELGLWLQVLEGALTYRQAGIALRWGPLALPLPGWLSPRVEAREEAHGPDQIAVSVAVWAPLAGFLLSYDGLLRPEMHG
jgi:hypothetical protein